MDDKTKKTVLVLAAHPDDELIGCGGSIAKQVAAGHNVLIAYATTGAVENPELPLQEFIARKKQETTQAMNVLGVPGQNLYFLGQQPSQIHELKLWQDLIEIVRAVQPNLCYVPHIGEKDQDHKLVSRLAVDAIVRAPSKWFRPYGTQAIPFSRPTIIAYEITDPLPDFQYAEDITGFVDKKMAALACHQTQRFQDFQYRTRGLNAFRGGREGKYNEVFQIITLTNPLL